jgi:hypothetical protein
MPLAAVQHARKRSLTITWKDEDGAAVNLTGATLTGIIERDGVQTSITGTLALVTAASGIFSWTFSAADVGQAGNWFAQFRAKYAADSLSEISYRTQFKVAAAFDFELVSPSVSPSLSPSTSVSPSASRSPSASVSPSSSSSRSPSASA